MTVDEDRQATARQRREDILRAFSEQLSAQPTSSASQLRRYLEGETRQMIGNLDIDGLCAAAMLASVSDWRLAVVVDRSTEVCAHPDFDLAEEAGTAEERLFGVDVFSALFPSASNHPVLFGSLPGRPHALRDAYQSHDDFMLNRVKSLGSISPSAWVEIGASLGSKHPHGLPYKYPLGTTQILLAALEAAGTGVRMFDRQYLPWMIANADGGATSIRAYAWNVELWWSAMAAAAGPASYSEALFQLVTTQRPNQFLDADRRLRWDEPDRSKSLKTSWNLKTTQVTDVQAAVELITSWSGWPDPFLGGVGNFSTWNRSRPTTGVLPLKGITRMPSAVLDAHLAAARKALHVNFSVFRERGTCLGWLLPVEDLATAAVVGPIGETLEAAEPGLDPDDESVPDAD